MLLNLERYHRPQSLVKALALLKAGHNGSIRPIAGGTHLVPSNNQRVREVVDITHLKLNFVKNEGPRFRIGATVTLQDIIDNKKLNKSPYDILAQACQTTSVSKMIRNVSTIGGELVHASPYSDITTALLILDPELVIAVDADRMIQMPLEEFLSKDLDKALQGGILTEIRFAQFEGGIGTSFIRLSQIQSSPTIMSVAAMIHLIEGVCKKARIALGVAGPHAKRFRAIESILEGSILNERKIETASENVARYIDPFTDVRASAEYRKAVGNTLVKRALLQCFEKIENKKIGN